MDLNDIRIFAEVVAAGSFTGAARRLEMPKSTVSRRVAELERRLGARLLQRTTRRVAVTDAGRTYYRYCERITAELEEGERAVSRLQEAPRGLLRVTAPWTFSFLGPALAALTQRYPEVRVDMVCTDRLVDLLEEGFDVAVRAGHLADSTLISRPIGSLERVVVASPDYLERVSAPAVPEELKEHTCLSFGAGIDREGWTLSSSERTVTVKLHAQLQVNDFDTLREIAVAGAGLAFVTTDRCRDELQRGRLIRVLPDWSSPPTPFHVLYPSVRHLSPKIRAFIDVLREYLGEDGTDGPAAATPAPARDETG